MDVVKDMRVKVFLFMLFVSCIAENPLNSGYIFTSPRSLKPGTKNQLHISRFGSLTGEDILNVKLYQESYDENETLFQEQEYKLEKGKSETLLDFFVNPIDVENVYTSRIEINGTIDGEWVSGSDIVQFSNPKNLYIIQTDKPIYKPGQEVKFRVLKVDRNLKPTNDKDDIAEVYVEDAKGNRLFHKKNVHLGEGIKQFEMELSEEPVLGNWRITVRNNNLEESQTFEVKEYILPKFDVKIQFPPWVLGTADEFPIEICAKYTYGKPVKGILNLNISLEKDSYGYLYNLPVLQELIKIDGCYNYTLNVSRIETNATNRRDKIKVVANVVEKGTEVQTKELQYLHRTFLPFKLKFDNDQAYRQLFKPGLPYNGRLKVTNPDDSPASGKYIQICASVSRKRIIFDWMASKEVTFCRNYTSDDEGFIKYALTPQSNDVQSVRLEAKALEYGKESESKYVHLSLPFTQIHLHPYFSPSGNFIQMETYNNPIPCGSQKNISLLFTSEEKTEIKFQYQIIKQGKIVRSGHKIVNFNVEEDVSKKLDIDEFINGSEAIWYPRQQRNSYLKTDLDDENCQNAPVTEYVPPIGEVSIPVDVDATLSPSFTLLVFYVRKDRETVADSQKIEVEKCFKNKVEFKFGDEAQQPGARTSIKVTSSPHSLCGLKVVDKSVSLLNSNDQLTKEKLSHFVENVDKENSYNRNPCKENIPQPGLHSTTQPPTSLSSYEDSLLAFQSAGYLVISNLRLFTRPCKTGGASPRSGRRKSKLRKQGSLRTMAYVKPKKPSPTSASTKIGTSATKSIVDVRDYFPETWLFQMESTGSDGVYVAKQKLPHTITEWVGTAVCMNLGEGLGLSNTATIKGFQVFFISYNLPYSVIRGEEFYITVSIFSYADEALPITVSLDESDKFEIINSLNSDICIQPDTSENLRIKLKATELGTVIITVRAKTAAPSDVCGNYTVYEGLAKDAITQQFECEAEGYPTENVESILFCPKDEKNRTFKGVLSLNLPDNSVPISARAVVDVTGNVLGPAIENLDSLVSLPTGCGEQNMVKFTPNYLVLDYLNDIGKLTDKVKSKAIKNLNIGYQRELTYRHNDGSFSAFGKSDKEGSMFLTAFVLRSFSQARKYITIDQNVINEAQKWIASKQQADGCFPNVGRIVDRGLQGGLEKEKNNGGITAYVVACLIISNFENETVIENALNCLSQDNELNAYDTFLYAYAEALGGKTESAKQRMEDISPFANKTEGLEYYRNANSTKSIDVETDAYAVLTKLKLGDSASDVLSLVRFLTKNLNPRGGFYSTQDTCVGLDALSQFASIVYKDPSDLQVTCSGSLDETKEITEDNKLLVQRTIVKDVPSEIQVEATGSGCGLIQAAIRYNTISPPEKHTFYFEVVGQCPSSDCKQGTITVIASYIPNGKASGMSVIEVKMVTGTVPDRDSLDNLKNDKNSPVLRADVENNSVIFYVNEITNQALRIVFKVFKVVEVVNPQPGVAKCYDYYAPEYSASTSYTFGDSDNSESAPDAVSPEP